MEETKIQIPIEDMDQVKKNLEPIFKVIKPKVRKDGGFASLRKHSFMIIPEVGKTIEDVKWDEVCTDFVVQTGQNIDKGYVIKFKIVNKDILICEFEKATRLKFNEFSGLNYVAKRFKYSQLYDKILPYDLIADLKGEEEEANKDGSYKDVTIEEFLKRKRNLE